MRIVLCHGCFDVLHIGHLWHLKAARAVAEWLIVTITADKYITKPGRPKFNQWQRLEMLKELRVVDQAFIYNARTGAEAIYDLRPSIFAKGPDYAESGICIEEVNACAKVGADIFFTPTKKYSSTELIAHL